MESQKTLNSHSSLKNKNKVGGITLADIRYYYKAMVIKTPWFQHKSRNTGETKRRAQKYISPMWSINL